MVSLRFDEKIIGIPVKGIILFLVIFSLIALVLFILYVLFTSSRFKASREDKSRGESKELLREKILELQKKEDEWNKSSEPD